MTKKTIGAGIAIDGEKEFKSAISGINKDLAVLGSEMGKVTAQYGDNAKSIEALNSKADIYNKQVDSQKQKVEAMKNALENAKNEYGENSAQVKNWQISLNKAEKDLANTENALARTTDEAKKLNKVDFSKFGEGLSKAGEIAGKAALALGAATLAAAAGIGAMTVKAAYAADDINTLSKQTGLSTEEIQKFQFASEQIDVPLETLTGSMAKLTRNMESARQGSKNQQGAFEALGVSITDSEGKLRSNQEVFAETIDALGKIENGTQRDAYAMQIFGKSAQDLNPLILGGADSLKELGDQAEAAGLILSQDALNNLNLLSDAIDTFKATAGSSGNLFATAFAGPMAEAINQVTGYIQQLSAAFNEGGFGAMADKLGEIISDIAVKVGEILPQLLEVGIEIIQKIVEGIIANIPTLVKSAMDIITTLAGAIIEMMPAILDAAIEIVIGLAEGLVEALPNLIPAAVEMIIKLVDTIATNLPKIIASADEIILALVTGLIGALPSLIKSIPRIVTAIVKGFADSGPSFKGIGEAIIEGVWEGISGMIKWIGDKVSGVASGLVKKMKGVLGIASPSKVFAEIGGFMAEGLGVGFENKIDNVSKNITGSIPIPQVQNEPDVFGMVSNLMSSQPAGGSTTLTINIDGKQVAKQIYDHLQGESKIRGTAFVAGV